MGKQCQPENELFCMQLEPLLPIAAYCCLLLPVAALVYLRLAFLSP